MIQAKIHLSFIFLHNNSLDLRRNLLGFPLDAKMQNKKNEFLQNLLSITHYAYKTQLNHF